MSLRCKSLVIVGATLVGLVAVSYIVSRKVLLHSFGELEQRAVGKEVRRVLSVLSDELSTLDEIVYDWAAWDDTYKFIEDANEDYIRSNLTDETFTGLRLNLMLFVHSSGRVVFGKAFDLLDDEEVPVPPSIQEHLRKGLLLRHLDTESRLTGILLLPEGPMLVASRPILTSKDQGPIRGTLIMGRYLNSSEVEHLSSTTHLPITLRRCDEPPMPPNFRSLSEGKPVVVRPVDEDLVAGYALLRDIYGNPALVLRVDVPRDIYRHGKTTIYYFILSLVTIGVIFGLVTLSLLERHIFSRLVNLRRDVMSIGGDPSARLRVEGKDEISDLAEDINRMLESLERTRKALIESEEHFRTVTERALVGVYIIQDGKFRYVNPALAEMFGYTQEELIDKLGPLELTHPDDRPLVAENIRRRLEGEVESVHYTFKGLCKDGRTIYCEALGRHTEYRGESAIIGTLLDITKRVQAEEEVKLRMRQLSALVRASGSLVSSLELDRVLEDIVSLAGELTGSEYSGVVLVDESGRTVRSFENLKGVLPLRDRIRDEGVTSWVVRTHRVVVVDDIGEDGFMEPPLGEGAPRKANPSLVKAGIRSLAGLPLVVKGRLLGVLYLHSSRPKAFRGQLSLLTAFANQAAIAVENARLYGQLRRIMEAVPDGVLVLDSELRLSMANPRALEFLPLLTDSRIGDVLSNLGGRAVRELLEFPPDGMPRHELVVQGRVFEVEARRVEVGPEQVGWVMVLHDATQEKEVQRKMELQGRLAAVGQLAAGIAHDFNNILQIIIGRAELLRYQPDLSDKLRLDIEAIHKQGQRAARLVRQILDFSRKSISVQGPLDLKPFVKETMKMLQRILPENIEMDVEAPDEGYWVRADPTQMEQVLTNLIVNARDAMPDGGRLKVGLYRRRLEGKPPFPGMTSGDWVVVEVSDTGLGIPPEARPHIFEPFFTTKRPDRGTGLGLAQVYGIVKQHRGFIDFESEVGRGTKFVIYLPAIRVEGTGRRKAEEEIPRGRGETILVVEDDDTVLKMVREMLTSLGYGVLTATNGREALEVFERYRKEIKLVLSDIVMPKMGGKELLGSLRRIDPEVKLAFISGYPLGEAIPEGTVGWVQKPVQVRELAKFVHRVLNAPPPGAHLRT